MYALMKENKRMEEYKNERGSKITSNGRLPEMMYPANVIRLRNKKYLYLLRHSHSRR